MYTHNSLLHFFPVRHNSLLLYTCSGALRSVDENQVALPGGPGGCVKDGKLIGAGKGILWIFAGNGTLLIVAGNGILGLRWGGGGGFGQYLYRNKVGCM